VPPLASSLPQTGAAPSAQPADSAALVIHGDTSSRGAALDSVLVRSPLPGGVDAAARWFFNRPQWVQIGGVVLAMLVAAAVAVAAWRRRRAILAWFAARSRAWKLAFAAAAGALVLAAAGGGAAGWNYMQHDNDFCVSCHVMTPAFQRFRTSEHRKLECHACHQQSIFASAQELYYWVAERPEKIPPHAPVPTRICATCHIQNDPDSSWKRIVATAGHRVHLFSDSAALKGKVECVTCHGQEVHRFVPADQTCGQSGCHDQSDTQIRLGKMASQTTLHCTGCHQFTRSIPEALSVDSARGAMTPGQQQCLDCHEMRVQLTELDPRREPHGGTCGTCHNPHTQETPAKAFESCTASGCHAGVDTITPMHRGLPQRVVADCAQCHEAHDWKVQATACLDCHRDIFDRPGARATPRRSAAAGGVGGHVSTAPAPGAARDPPVAPAVVALLRLASSASPEGFVAHGGAAPGGGAGTQPPARAGGRLPPFSHAIHRDVGCTSCHTSERRHGETTVRTARDCASCHHRPDREVGCAGCHAEREPAPPSRVTVRMRPAARAPARDRPLPFAHTPHREVACRDCHTAPVTLAVERTCASCHAEHHVPAANCMSCHPPPAKDAHTRASHEGCATSGCHASAVAAALPPTRAVCLSCHQDLTRHKPGRECADCHRVSWPTTAGRPS
jgi:nitrate/TMAO reductase-like tetraheme cytochrome c subunit